MCRGNSAGTSNRNCDAGHGYNGNGTCDEHQREEKSPAPTEQEDLKGGAGGVGEVRIEVPVKLRALSSSEEALPRASSVLPSRTP